jgi:sulfur carrier protein
MNRLKPCKPRRHCDKGLTIIRLRFSNCWIWLLWRIIYGVNRQDTIEITVNGEARQMSQGARVMDLVKQLELAPERLAIELNLSILPRAKWAETELKPGDKLEVVHFVGGG